jgi:hypothetical protein
VSEPPKEKRAPVKSALLNTALPGAYYFARISQARRFAVTKTLVRWWCRVRLRFLRFLQRPFGFLFWMFERIIADIDIESERRG